MYLDVVQNSQLAVLVITFYLEKRQIRVVVDQASLPLTASLSAQIESIVSWSRGCSGTCADSQS